MNELKKSLENEQKIRRDSLQDLLYKTGDTKKERVYDFRKYRTMQSFGITISNGTTILENAYNDQMYLKDTINNLKKSVRPRLPGKIDEKELTLKNVNELLAGRKWDINSFESGIFPMRTVNAADMDDYHYIFDNELRSEGTLTPKILATPPIILDPPSKG